MTYEVWFTYGEHLFVTSRTGPFTVAVGRASVEALLDGATSEEAGAGVGSAVPDATELLDLTIEDGTATVDLSGAFESGGGTLSMRMRLAQVVWTLTQFESVDGVAFEVDGQGGTKPSGARASSSTGPRPGPIRGPAPGHPDRVARSSAAEVGNPVTISGTANVFEATVSVRILDERGDADRYHVHQRHVRHGLPGRLLRRASGTRSVTISPGRSWSSRQDALDGTPQNVVSIPVVLSA